MTHLDRNQGELFDGLTVGGVGINPHYANWLDRKAIPQVSRLINELEAAGEISPAFAKQMRLGLLVVRHKLRGTDPD